MNATNKSQGINDLLEILAGKPRVETISKSCCMTCKATNVKFRDTLSRKEYKISGMCQKCQDDVFGVS